VAVAAQGAAGERLQREHDAPHERWDAVMVNSLE
jgi:hypothetical protein